MYDNANQTLRSEQSSISERRDSLNGGGVPGALANQPPEGGQLVEGAGGLAQAGAAGASPKNSSRNSVKNYEVDRTIRHSQSNAGSVLRLTVAVLVDDRVEVEEGETTRTPLTKDEIDRITTLVQQTIGYEKERGDLVNVINASFTAVEAIEDLPEPSIMDNRWVQFALKWIWPFILIMVVIFTILKPSIKGLTSYMPPTAALPGGENADSATATAGGGAAALGPDGEPLAIEGGEGGTAQLGHDESIPLPSDHDEKVEFAKSMAQQDPKKVANVVKDWVGNES